ncbi:MAG: hypothetical protein H6869_08920 [Rhodospirillales bacterium]|nr:hypothetical protein [Rhodospirillales bacterium]
MNKAPSREYQKLFLESSTGISQNLLEALDKSTLRAAYNKASFYMLPPLYTMASAIIFAIGATSMSNVTSFGGVGAGLIFMGAGLFGFIKSDRLAQRNKDAANMLAEALSVPKPSIKPLS